MFGYSYIQQQQEIIYIVEILFKGRHKRSN